MKKPHEIKHLSLRVEAEALEKFHHVCAYEGRSANSQLLVYIRKCIREFEAEHGEISIDETK